MLRTQSFYFERFTQQISSVSTKQSLAGVKSSVDDQMRNNGLQTSLHQKINEEILKSVNSQEVNSLVRTRRTGAPVTGNGLRECLQNIESLEKSLRFAKICDRVSIGMCYTISDVDDGLRSNTSMPRVCTPSCRQRFQSLCRNSMKNTNWTSHSSSHHTKSWQSWTCNSDSITDKPRSKILGW